MPVSAANRIDRNAANTDIAASPITTQSMRFVPHRILRGLPIAFVERARTRQILADALQHQAPSDSTKRVKSRPFRRSSSSVEMRAMRASLGKTCQVGWSNFNSVMGYSVVDLLNPRSPKGGRMLDSLVIDLEPIVVSTHKAFYAALGQRVAVQRKTLGLTQQQLADTLGIAQQTLAHYEVGRLRIAAALLPRLSQLLRMPLEELLGEPVKAGKRGPTPRLQAQLERIGSLPRGKQRMLLDMLDAALQSSDSQAA